MPATVKLYGPTREILRACVRRSIIVTIPDGSLQHLYCRLWRVSLVVYKEHRSPFVSSRFGGMILDGGAEIEQHVLNVADRTVQFTSTGRMILEARHVHLVLMRAPHSAHI